MKTKQLPELLLRVGTAFALFYPAVSAWFDPYSWIGYFPNFMVDIAGNADLVLLHGFGVLEILLALWILFGRRIFIPCIIVAVLLITIVAFNWNQLPVLFRDLAIACMVLALAFWKKS